MSHSIDEALLKKLAGQGAGSEEDESWASVAATSPDHTETPREDKDSKLQEMLRRINGISKEELAENEQAEKGAESGFLPIEPTSFQGAGLNESEIEALVLKFLLARGEGKGRDISDQIALPFAIMEDLLGALKHDQLVYYKNSGEMNDYVYALTDLGRERARRHLDQSSYFGEAPVPLEEYRKSVQLQSLEHQRPTQEKLKAAFSDLLINPTMLGRLGPAINSGKGMFLFGFPGNGKTSIAERVTRAFGQYIWIPRTIGVDGDILRIYDPSNHEEAPVKITSGLLSGAKIDKRWIRIRRPTIVVGGELTMESLEVSYNSVTGISEAPMQLKSNCGTLVIDDFGRQRMSTDELLNRWIVPLEKRTDFLNLKNGKKIQVPFDQLIIFSTNLEPKELVDDAFLRRIPYKIEVLNPSEEEFRELFNIMCPIIGCEFNQSAIDHVIQKHYKEADRPFRCCQPRDLLLQVKNYCLYKDTEFVLTNENFDFAVENYFAVM